MIGRRITIKRGSRDDAEKPFWISFADLMTALMVLFLVALSAALMNAQKETERARMAEQAAKQAQQALVEEKKKRDLSRERRTAEMKTFLDEVQKVVGRHEGVVLDRERFVINFGTRAQFPSGKHELTLDQANALRRLVPELLASVRDEVGHGRNWLKRIVAEGFTDDTGSYLFNLNLSLQRSQRVLCVLLAREWPIYVPIAKAIQATTNGAGPNSPASQPATVVQFGEIAPINADDELLIRTLFLVGGYSSNSQKASRDESRRIELRIEFFQVDEVRHQQPPLQGDVGKCIIGAR
jgi:outer membrane protein OmpA-like peptidoglycan-associated protein